MQVKAATGAEDVVQFCGGLRAVLAAAGVDVSRCFSPGKAGSPLGAAQAACAGSVVQGSSKAQPSGGSAGSHEGSPASGDDAGALRGTCAGVAAAQAHIGSSQPLWLAADAGSNAGGTGLSAAAQTSARSWQPQGGPSDAGSGSSQRLAPATHAAGPTGHGAAGAYKDMESAAPADGIMVKQPMASCKEGMAASEVNQPTAARKAGNAGNAELQLQQQPLQLAPDQQQGTAADSARMPAGAQFEPAAPDGAADVAHGVAQSAGEQPGSTASKRLAGYTSARDLLACALHQAALRMWSQGGSSRCTASPSVLLIAVWACLGWPQHRQLPCSRGAGSCAGLHRR